MLDPATLFAFTITCFVLAVVPGQTLRLLFRRHWSEEQPLAWPLLQELKSAFSP